MGVIAYVLYGVLQGLTEFLPVSSSGHLVAARALLGFGAGQGPLWEVAAHVGTLLAIVTVFWKDLWAIVRSLRRMLSRLRGREGLGAALEAEPQTRVALAIIVGSVPAAVIGLAFKDWLESQFESPVNAMLMVIVTGAVLAATAGLRPGRKAVPGWMDAVVIGLAQAVAILPGISRSGSTIATGLLRGLDRAEAGRFSFLLGLPALAGAAVLELRHALPALRAEAASMLAVVAGAYVVGTLSLVLLLRVVRSGALWWFAVYCIPAGTAGALLFAVR